jgi:hypothetical protein
VTGVSLSIEPPDVALAVNTPVQVRLAVSTSAAPTPGTVLIRIGARDRVGRINAVFDVVLIVRPPVPADGGRPQCPGLNPAGSPPAAGPEVLPLRQAINQVFSAKAAALGRTTFSIDAAATDQRNGWRLDIEKAPATVPTLRPDEAVVVLVNTRTWDKSLLTVDSRNCNAAGRSLTVLTGQRAQFRIASTDTTTVLLRRRVRRFWLLGCWDSGGSEDVALFNEPNFWTLFGGRQVTITWVASFQKFLEQ